MTNREHFEQWVRYVKPNMPLDRNEQVGYYYNDTVSLMWLAWLQSPKKRPTEEGKMTKDQKAAMLVDPETIVDRLRGIYPNGVTYPANPLQKAAADEIERLRKDADRYQWSVKKHDRFYKSVDDMWDRYMRNDGHPSKEEFDEAIDAAMNETKTAPKGC